MKKTLGLLFFFFVWGWCGFVSFCVGNKFPSSSAISSFFFSFILFILFSFFWNVASKKTLPISRFHIKKKNPLGLRSVKPPILTDTHRFFFLNLCFHQFFFDFSCESVCFVSCLLFSPSPSSPPPQLNT